VSGKPDYVKKKYKSLKDKTLKTALAQRLGAEFPRLGGPRILDLCAEMVLEVLEAHLRPREGLGHGQVLWAAVAIDDPPRRGKPLAQCRLVPTILDLSVPEDIDDRIARLGVAERLLKRAERLCRQAYEQGGLLSNCDLAELLNVHDSRIAQLLAREEQQRGAIIPRRATVHDVGTGLTHKRIICRKRYLEGKDPETVARETHHSLEAVDRYLGQYDRVRHCRIHGLTPEETALILNCSMSLVNEYLKIDRELEQQHG
jgi:hypothetical protein